MIDHEGSSLYFIVWIEDRSFYRVQRRWHFHRREDEVQRLALDLVYSVFTLSTAQIARPCMSALCQYISRLILLQQIRLKS